jgi:hypothetical protein
MERGRGLDVAKKIKDKEHFGRSTIVRVGAQFSESVQGLFFSTSVEM